MPPSDEGLRLFSRVIAGQPSIIRDHPDQYDAHCETVFQKLVDKLEPPSTAA